MRIFLDFYFIKKKALKEVKPYYLDVPKYIHDFGIKPPIYFTDYNPHSASNSFSIIS